MSVAPEDLWLSTETVLVKTSVAGWYFDAVLSLSHQLTATVTTHPVETGAAISDHMFVNPRSLTLQIGMSDVAYGVAQPDPFAGPGSRSVTAFTLLRDLQRARVPVQVVTRLDSYDNMVVESITAADDASSYLGLKATVALKEVLVARVSRVAISSKPQVTDSTPRGDVEPKQADDTLTLQLDPGGGKTKQEAETGA